MKNPLDNSRPLRLHLKDGKWTLDFESLEQVSAVVFRPVVYSVEGPEPILGALERMQADDQLIAEAQGLFQQFAGEAEGELNLEPQHETWIQSATEAYGLTRHGEPPMSMGERLARRRQALKRGIEQIRSGDGSSARIEVLERRIAELEAKLKDLALNASVGPKINFGGAKGPVKNVAMTQEVRPEAVEEGGLAPEVASGNPEAEDAIPAPIPLQPKDDEPSDDGLEVAQSADDSASSPGEEEDGSREESADDAGEPAPAAEEAEEPAGPMIPEMPDVSDFQGMFRMLVGTDVNLTTTSSDRVVAFTKKTKHIFMAQLIDDDDNVIGGMIADLQALVRLGGGLLMMPDEVINEQLEAMEPEEDVIEAMSEVFNTASSLINEIEGNPHVRVTPVEPLKFSENDWLESPPLRIDMEHEDGGQVIIASR